MDQSDIRPQEQLPHLDNLTSPKVHNQFGITGVAIAIVVIF